MHSHPRQNGHRDTAAAHAACALQEVVLHTSKSGALVPSSTSSFSTLTATMCSERRPPCRRAGAAARQARLLLLEIGCAVKGAVRWVGARRAAATGRAEAQLTHAMAECSSERRELIEHSQCTYCTRIRPR